MDGRDDAIEPSLDREETRRDERKNALVDSSIDARVAKRRPRRLRASRVPRRGAAFPLDAIGGCEGLFRGVVNRGLSRDRWLESLSRARDEDGRWVPGDARARETAAVRARWR